MPKYKLIKDLPSIKADDTEWEQNFAIFIDSNNGTRRFIWYEEWGDPLTSGWFEEVKPKRWVAKKEQTYFFLDEALNAYETRERNWERDCRRFNSYNYFRTQEQAEEAANRIKKLLAEYQKEINKE